MSREEISKVVKGLQSCAVAFQEGIRKANHLPHDYPKAEMEAIVEQIQAISGGDNDDLKVIIHLHDKLLQSIDAYASDDEPAATDHLRRLHGEVFIAVARFVKNIDPERVQAIAPVVEPGKLVAGSADYHLAAQQLLSEPIQEVGIQEQWAGLVKRRSMTRIMASRTKAAALRA